MGLWYAEKRKIRNGKGRFSKMEKDHVYIAIDLKSFYASVECVERQLDPMNTNLVVADASGTEKTICLAVSPSLKAFGISGRARLFEVVQKVKEVNHQRKADAPEHKFTGESYLADELLAHPEFSVSYLIAPPRMAHYIYLHRNILCQSFFLIKIIQKTPQGRHFPYNTGCPVLLFTVFRLLHQETKKYLQVIGIGYPGFRTGFLFNGTKIILSIWRQFC